MPDPRPTVIGVLHGELGDRVCFDRYQVLQMAGLQHAHVSLDTSDAFVWWMIELFVQDPIQKRRIRRGYDSVAIFYHNLAKLHHHVYGTPVAIPHRLIRAQRRELLLAWFPEAREILDEATSGQVLRAAANLKRLTTRAEWLGVYPRR